ncbi:HlyD family secretion protein [Pusillimonas sp. MFBS29]|uniref:HlyD family secretion protein n=1 Tax=Pusillimonas sp. MFBS29 TaxID=2886690 RepID=UPI00272E7999|nr:HlyD family secretion protein [Pusillimonas sp. MFBS29]
MNEGVRNDALLVPQQAVMRDQKGDPFVWVVDADSKAQRRSIVTLRTVGNQWLVGGGLSSGEQVVTEGVQRVRQDMEVVAKPAENVSVVMDFSDVDESASAAQTEAKDQAAVSGKPDTNA